MSAAALRALQVPGTPLVLPNVWDADSAKAVEAAGFPVVATSSLAVAAVLGLPDGDKAPADEMFAAARRIVDAVSVPVTVDAEGGYRLPPAELVVRLLEIGAVGLNFEDSDYSGTGLHSVEAQAERIAGIRAAAGSELVINARIDVFLGQPDQESVFAEAVERGRAYREAGADSVYPIFLRPNDLIREFVRTVGGAVNVSALPGGPGISGLAELGVARISMGGGLWRHLRSALEGVLGEIAQGKLPY